MAKLVITQEYLKSILDYNPETGVFTNRFGKQLGSIDKDGYLRFHIKGRSYAFHRLAFLYMNGEIPPNNMQVDHINGIKTDNRWCNLRLVTHRQNGQNRIEHRNGHLIGTVYHPAIQKWEGRIRINKKRVYLGLFSTQQEAHEAYVKALNQLNEHLPINM